VGVTIVSEVDPGMVRAQRRVSTNSLKGVGLVVMWSGLLWGWSRLREVAVNPSAGFYWNKQCNRWVYQR